MCTTSISPGLMINAGMLFGLKQEDHLRWTRDRSRVNWEDFVRCQVRANETYSEAKHKFNNRNRVVLMNVQSPYKLWSTLKFAVIGTCSSLPLLISEGSGLVCESVGKADLLSDHFDSKESREAVDLPLTYHPSSSLTTFAFRSREVSRLMLHLDPYGGTDPLGMFPRFLRRTADVMAPRFSEVFRRLVRQGSFQACWKQANVTPIPKGPPFYSVANYRPISITSVLSKVFERLVSVHLGRFMKCSGVLPTTQFANREGLGTCDAFLCVSHKLQSALESGQEVRFVQIDFSAAFDWVNHQGILYRLCSVGSGGSLLSILTQFLSNRPQHVMVDGCHSKLVDVVSRVRQGSVLDPFLFLLDFGAFFHFEK